MSKRIIITESEKNDIKSLYNINEQGENLIDKIFSLGDLKLTTNSGSSSDIESMSGPSKKISEKGQELLKNPIFKKKLQEISDAIHIDKDSIIKLMNHESGLNPSIKNSIGCVGLIQFCPSSGAIKTINGKQYSLDDLTKNLEVQMEAIKQFWLSGYKNGKIKSADDLYIYNFFPVAAGKSNDFVLQAKGLSAQKVASSNPVFNKVLGKQKSEPLTVGDLKNYYRKTGMV
jgi:hypothetical protein